MITIANIAAFFLATAIVAKYAWRNGLTTDNFCCRNRSDKKDRTWPVVLFATTVVRMGGGGGGGCQKGN